MSGQSIVDRLNAAKHTVAGSALGRAVVKATTEEIMGPKRKHLDYLLQCTSEINVSIPQMADLLIERTQNTSWVVTFKALITIHHLMCFGNERFSQYMASHSSKFTLNNFMDRTGTQGIDMSSYIRKYAFYLNEKRETYKLMGFDFCKVKRGKDDGLLRTMNTEKLLKTLPILQKQLDALIQFDVQPNELTNGVISSCFILLSKDLIRLFACYNDGIINLLEKFFDMNKKNCREALEIYKKFLERTDSVAAFLKVAESSGMDKGDIPDLTKAPSSLLEALESHVNTLEGKKGTNGTAPVQASASTSNAVNSAINSLNNNTQLSAEEKRRIVEEEAKTLEAFKKQTSVSSVTNESAAFASAPTPQPSAAMSQPPAKPTSNDLFDLDLGGIGGGSSDLSAGAAPAAGSRSAGDDLLQLSGANPFIQNIVNQSYASQPGMGAAPMMMANPFQANPMMMTGMAMQAPQAMNAFPPMGNPMMSSMSNNNQQFDAFGDVLKPTNSSHDLSKQQSNGNLAAVASGGDKAGLPKDLDSSLAQLADNLDINYKNKSFGNKNHQWNASQQQNQQAKTGGQNWKPGGSTTPTMPMSTGWPATGMAPAPMMGAAPMVAGGTAWMGAPVAPVPAAAMNPFGAPMGMAGAQPNPMMMNPMMMQAKPAGIQPQPSRPTANPFDLL